MYKKLESASKERFITESGVLAQAFPVAIQELLAEPFKITGSVREISDDFSHGSPKNSPFRNAGVMINRNVSTMKVGAEYSGKHSVLGDVILPEKEIPEEFFLDGDLAKWKYLKGGKKELRTTRTGHTYNYSEGPVVFPDPLDKPSRTIVTGEGGRTPSRFKHVIKTKSGRYRRLTPLELERLDMFPDNHTKLDGVSDATRAFIMGNALVVGVIEELGKTLARNV